MNRLANLMKSRRLILIRVMIKVSNTNFMSRRMKNFKKLGKEYFITFYKK